VTDFDDPTLRHDSALLYLRSFTKATAYFEPITKAQRDSIAPSPGMIIYMSYYDPDSPEGLYVYHSTSGWVMVLLNV
jgi:hypothetical protein